MCVSLLSPFFSSSPSLILLPPHSKGMPCVGGVPQEFAAQDAITLATKATFPGSRIIQYRIGTAVPYAEIVHTAIVEHPEWFVRWHHAPNDNGTVCSVSAEAQTGRPGDNCAWPIRASMYDFSQPLVRSLLARAQRRAATRYRLFLPAVCAGSNVVG